LNKTISNKYPRRRKLATHGSHEITKENEKKDLDHDG